MKPSVSPSPSQLVSPLASQIRRFLQFKRALGCRYREEERALRVLDRFLASRLSPKDPVITNEIIHTYVARWGTESDTTRGHRLSLLRELCRFLATEDPRTPIPSVRLFAIHRPTFVPRVLTLEEASRFLKACESLLPGRCSPLRGVVHGTALTLLYLTGMRVGEVLALTMGDVDLVRQVLHVRNAKFGKARLVPIAPGLADRLLHCRRAVERHFGAQSCQSPFFPGPKGARCTSGRWRDSFRNVLRNAGIPYAGIGIRLHDLRHAFACHRMILWFKQGADLEAKLPLLSTYLGHVGLASTQRYLRLTEDLLGEVTRRHEARFGHLITDRRNA